MATGQLFYGPASDRYGRKRPLKVGLGIFVFAGSWNRPVDITRDHGRLAVSLERWSCGTEVADPGNGPSYLGRGLDGQDHFGVVALCFGTASFLNARIIGRFGLSKVLRVGSLTGVATSGALTALVLGFGGKPPVMLLILRMAVMLPVISGMAPNCNSAAMAPMPHVAGMATAILGTAGTGAVRHSVPSRTGPSTARLRRSRSTPSASQLSLLVPFTLWRGPPVC